MQIPHPHINIRAREVFRRLYKNNRLNIQESKKSLEEQLDLYLEHLGAHMGHQVSDRDQDRIWAIIERNNQVAKILENPNFRSLVKKERQLLGSTILGLVFCIDGRIPAIFLGGRFARHFEIPAAEISVIKRKSDGKLVPDSTDLNEGLRRVATDEDDLLEIVCAHTSLLDPHHGCGAMAAKRNANLLDPKLSNEQANLKIIKEKSIPALTNIYNEFRQQHGLEPLKVVGISALYDTDTFGIILNYDLRDQHDSLSTTQLTTKYQDTLDDFFIKNNLVFGAFKDKFSELKFLTPFSKNIVQIIEAILDSKVAPDLLQEVNDYIEQHYIELTDSQQKALRFILIRNIAFQYLTGLCKVKKSTLHHPFATHEEGYMSVAMRGATIGKFDPASQAFASTPADPGQAIHNINTMLSIMGDSAKIKPYILFICNSVNNRDLRENNHIIQRLMGSNAGLLRDIIADKKLGGMIENGELIPVPVLIEEDTRELLKIIDHSAYI